MMPHTDQDVIDAIEEYVAGSIEGQDTIDRMSFTRFLRHTLTTYAQQQVAQEREACAKILRDHLCPENDESCNCIQVCYAAIKAQGETP